MQNSGHPHNQAVAAALHNAYDYKGGKVKSSDMNASQSKRFMEKGDVGKSTKEKYYAEGGNISAYRTKNMHLTREEHVAKAKELRGAQGSDKYKQNMNDLAEFHESEANAGYAEGGEVEDQELHEGVMKELGDHLKNGNHKEALESLKALVMSMKD